MITDSSLIKQTKVFKLSTQSSSGLCLNEDSNFKSSFRYHFPITNFQEEDIEFVYLSVPYVSLPVSFYNIDYQNNRLDMIVSGMSISYIFRSGNYNALTFMNEFRRVVDGFSISIDNVTNCFTITNTTNALITFTLLASSTISAVMGFSSDIASITSSSSVGYYVVCPRTCNFLPIPRIHLRCRELASSCLISKNHDSDILVSVPNDSVPGGKIVYRNFMGSTNHLELPFLQSLVINFSDEQGYPINFNGVSSYFELQFDIYRKRPEKPPTFRNVIKQLSQLSRILE